MTKAQEQKVEKEEKSNLTAGMIKKRDEMLTVVTALIAEIGPKAEAKAGEPLPANHEEYVRGLAALYYLDGLLRRTDKRNYLKNIDYSMTRFVTKDQLAVLKKGGINDLKDYFEHSLSMIKGMFKRSADMDLPLVLVLLHQGVRPVSVRVPAIRQNVWSSMISLSGEEVKAPTS